MEKIPNLNIGDQEFQKVGEVKQYEGSRTYPEPSYSLYQDIKDGALMGELPENHPVNELIRENEKRDANKEKRERLSESADFDLTKLTPLEAANVLAKIKGDEFLKQNLDLKIYGKINNGGEEELSVFKWIVKGNDWHYSVFYKHDISKVAENYHYCKTSWMDGGNEIPFGSILERLPNVEIKPEYITVAGKNSLLIGGEEGKGSAEVSFLEIPEAYNEMMKEKEGKAE